eukprot:CAMPEP_0202968684 /NCGR_PEP_ID=MMETSP1396-20130829/14066_1 /ASSEMBLY_ACC=CAM_ASM_000872 /TAXON_ID= /ORGANISM="Pseudokeronopsis sp., Strain Brazil" /LENGTH=47 /DNA_ID= /DNA_START= /DNA_END= /DNA_ORIENTATION=
MNSRLLQVMPGGLREKNLDISGNFDFQETGEEGTKFETPGLMNLTLQ